MTDTEKTPNSSSDGETTNLVDWDGPDDRANPRNWSPSRKVVSITIVALINILSPIGSTICSASATDIMADFTTHNDTLMTFVTTIFVLGYASGPVFIAPLSEMYGRTILYQICAALFLVFNVACAAADSLGSLVVYRFLAGVAGSCPIALGPGSVADMVAQEKRGGAMGAYVVGVLLGSSIGPIIGGYLAPVVGWRWGFWVMAIITAPVLLLGLFLLPESYPFVILQRKEKRLRRETGNDQLRSVLDTGRTPRDLFAFSIIRPLKMLLLPIVLLLSLYIAVVYSYLYILFTTFPIVFGDQYGFGSGPAGLATLGIGIGSVIGAGLCGAAMDRLSNYLAAKHGGERKPEYRLPVMTVGGLLVPAGLFMYAWTAYNRAHWIVPIIASGIFACGLNLAFMACTMYLVDEYSDYAASVTAASAIFRCFMGAFLPLAGPALNESLGIGWGGSLLGFIALAFIPLPMVFFRYGERIRETRLIPVNI